MSEKPKGFGEFDKLARKLVQVTPEEMPAPKCPKCGIEMGRQTVPDDGSWWCGNLKCMYHMNADGTDGEQ